MPKLQACWSSEGRFLSSAFVTLSRLQPSRASILTGRYPHNTGVRGTRPPAAGSGLPPSRGEKDTIARGSGRRVPDGARGEVLNEYPMAGSGRHVGPGWDFWSATQGDAPYFDFLMNVDGAQRHFPKGPRTYSTDVIRDRALEFIRQSPGDGQPSLLPVRRDGRPSFPGGSGSTVMRGRCQTPIRRGRRPSTRKTSLTSRRGSAPALDWTRARGEPFASSTSGAARDAGRGRDAGGTSCAPSRRRGRMSGPT